MSDSSSEINYSPDYEPFAADDNQEVPSYLHEPSAADEYDDVYEASSGESDVGEEDDDVDEDEDEDEDLKKYLPSEGNWVTIPGVIAGYDRDAAQDALFQWGHDNGLVVSRRSAEEQMYFYSAGVGRVSQKKKSPAERGIAPKDSRTCTTTAAPGKAEKCPFSLQLSKRKAGMREHWVMSDASFVLHHNHPLRTPSQKKLLAKLELPPEDLAMILDLGKSFVPPRNIVEFMRKRGYHNITTKHP